MKNLTNKLLTRRSSMLGSIALFTSILLSGCGVGAGETESGSKMFNLANLPSEQAVLVITPNSEAIQGQMYRFERSESGWQSVSPSSPVVIGRTGLAWGIGLHPEQPGQQKKEGDGKAPAGVFSLSGSFGYLDNVSTGLDYQQMTAAHYCVDVPGSSLYNQTVSTEDVGVEAVKGSSEPMRRDIHKQDMVYKKGIFVDHNPEFISGSGSCIFMHLWRADDKPTAGCTAMPESVIDELLAWLQKDKQPVLISLTEEDYQRLKSKWALPKI